MEEGDAREVTVDSPPKHDQFYEDRDHYHCDGQPLLHSMGDGVAVAVVEEVVVGGVFMEDDVNQYKEELIFDVLVSNLMTPRTTSQTKIPVRVLDKEWPDTIPAIDTDMIRIFQGFLVVARFLR